MNVDSEGSDLQKASHFLRTYSWFLVGLSQAEVAKSKYSNGSHRERKMGNSDDSCLGNRTLVLKAWQLHLSRSSSLQH